MNLQEEQPSEYEIYGFQLYMAESKDVLGTTYKALELSNQRTFAVQIFDPLINKDTVLLEALEDYSFRMSKLNHTNIQSVFNLKNGDLGPILVKEYIEGIRLDEYLQQKKSLDWQHALRFIRQLLHGLSCAHEAGLVHFSLAPDNIFISRGNTAKLANIGLNHIIKENSFLSEEEWNRSLARKYVSPEALTNDFITTGEASDIYSLGLIAYEMLTGVRPGGSSDSNYFVEENLSSATQTPAHHYNRTIPEELSFIIQKATEYHAVHRYSNAKAMLKALDEVSTISTKPNVVYHRRTRVRRRSSRLIPTVLLIIGGALALLGTGFYFLQQNNQNPFLALQNEPQRSNQASAAPPVIAIPESELPETVPPVNALQVTAQPVTSEQESPDTPAISQDSLIRTPQEIQAPVEQVSQTFAGVEVLQEPDVAALPDPISQEPATTSSTPHTKRSLTVRSTPIGAMVSIDGKEMGNTPFNLSNITDSTIQVVLSLPGHKDLDREVQLEEDYLTEVFFNLIPINRPLIVTVFPWGNIYLDGELMAERVSGTDTLMIAPEHYTLSIVHPSFGSWEKVLNQQLEELLEFTIDFRERAALRISAFDDNKQVVAGEVIIDGHNTGQVTPITIELPVGKHSIEIRAVGFETFRLIKTIDFANAQPEPIKLQMRKK